MHRLGLLLLLMLIVSCVAIDDCKKKTKKACKKAGGECQSREIDCKGVWKIGKKYCKKPKKCGCCIPPQDCKNGTLPSCEALNGTCISQERKCDDREREVTGETFCKFKDCKCCFPEAPCDCETERKCHRPQADPKRYYPIGRCRKQCSDDEEAYDRCNITNQDCSCCLTRKVLPCKPAMCNTRDGVEGKCSRDPINHSMNVGPLQCKDGCDCWIPECRPIGDRCTENYGFCTEPDKSCPPDYSESSDCYKPVYKNGVWIQSLKCNCCKPYKPVCESKYDQCIKPDYCVEKGDWKCTKGFARVHNKCFKTSSHLIYTGGPGPRDSVSLDIILPYSKNCDCCMNTGCRSIGDDCTGKGEFCIDPSVSKSCPDGYSGRKGCHKPVIENGIIVAHSKCICCKPDCGRECYSPDLNTCRCVIPGPCPKDSCHYASGQCPHHGCTCCNDTYPSDCKPKRGQCNAPDDYCVEKHTGNCHTGFIKFPNACSKDTATASQDCDCCKSSGCFPIEDRCSGVRDFCIDQDQTCPTFYKASPDCYKASANQTLTLCKCCKPLFIVSVEEKFWVREPEPVTTRAPRAPGKK